MRPKGDQMNVSGKFTQFDGTELHFTGEPGEVESFLKTQRALHAEALAAWETKKKAENLVHSERLLKDATSTFDHHKAQLKAVMDSQKNTAPVQLKLTINDVPLEDVYTEEVPGEPGVFRIPTPGGDFKDELVNTAPVEPAKHEFHAPKTAHEREVGGFPNVPAEPGADFVGEIAGEYHDQAKNIPEPTSGDYVNVPMSDGKPPLRVDIEARADFLRDRSARIMQRIEEKKHTPEDLVELTRAQQLLELYAKHKVPLATTAGELPDFDESEAMARAVSRYNLQAMYDVEQERIAYDRARLERSKSRFEAKTARGINEGRSTEKKGASPSGAQQLHDAAKKLSEHLKSYEVPKETTETLHARIAELEMLLLKAHLANQQGNVQYVPYYPQHPGIQPVAPVQPWSPMQPAGPYWGTWCQQEPKK